MSDDRWPLVDVGYRDPDEEPDPEPVDAPTPDEYSPDPTPAVAPAAPADRPISELSIAELTRELAFGSVRGLQARDELERRAGGTQTELFGPFARPGLRC